MSLINAYQQEDYFQDANNDPNLLLHDLFL
jgi:hypothetical protein